MLQVLKYLLGSASAQHSTCLTRYYSLRVLPGYCGDRICGATYGASRQATE